jgi:hypothetical protein
LPNFICLSFYPSAAQDYFFIATCLVGAGALGAFGSGFGPKLAFTVKFTTSGLVAVGSPDDEFSLFTSLAASR